MKKNLIICVFIILCSACKSDSSGIDFIFDGFNTQMTLPEAWHSGVLLKKNADQLSDNCSAEYIVTFTGSDGKKNEYLGSISIFSSSEWAAVPVEWKGIYVKIAEIDGNLYCYKSNQSNPFAEASVAGQEYDSHFISMDKAQTLIVIKKSK